MNRPPARAARFRFRHETQIISSVVQGNGGLVTTLERLLGAKRVASQGHEHGLYEPKPGCVMLYPEYCAAGNGPELVVPIAHLLDDNDDTSVQLDMFGLGTPQDPNLEKKR